MNTRRIAVVLTWLATALLLSSCASDDGLMPREFNDKLEGVTADPSEYELTVVRCENDGEFIDLVWGITNLNDSSRTFAFDPFLTNKSGAEEKKLRELVGESVGSGEYLEWESFAGGGERFPLGEVECRFEVFDSVLGAFRDE